MTSSVLSTIYLIGLVVAMAIRTYYGLEYRKHTTAAERADSMRGESMAIRVFMALWGVAMLLPIVQILTTWLSFADYSLPSWAGGLGAVVYALAMWLLWRSHADLGANWSPVPEPVAAPELVTTGVFRYVRHPMYAAHLLWGIAQPLLIQNWIAGPLALVAIVGLLQRVPVEEEKLLQEFGSQYRDYMDRTGALFPKFGDG